MHKRKQKSDSVNRALVILRLCLRCPRFKGATEGDKHTKMEIFSIYCAYAFVAVVSPV